MPARYVRSAHAVASHSPIPRGPLSRGANRRGQGRMIWTITRHGIGPQFGFGIGKTIGDSHSGESPPIIDGVVVIGLRQCGHWVADMLLDKVLPPRIRELEDKQVRFNIEGTQAWRVLCRQGSLPTGFSADRVLCRQDSTYSTTIEWIVAAAMASQSTARPRPGPAGA